MTSLSLPRADRDQFWPRDNHADDLAMAMLQLGEVQAQESVEIRVGAAREVLAGQVCHLLVVAALAARVDGAAATVAAQVTVERGADVIELVKKGDELIVEILVQKPRQTKGHDIKHFSLAYEETLDLVGNTAPAARQAAVVKSQRRDAGLQSVRTAAPCLCGRQQDP